MIIWIIIGLAVLSGFATFTLFFKIALDEMDFGEASGFWRKVLMVVWAALLAIVCLYFYSKSQMTNTRIGHYPYCFDSSKMRRYRYAFSTASLRRHILA